MAVKLLDCTLRDGGHQNDSKFGENVIDDILTGLLDTKVDYIEVGLLRETFVGIDYAAENDIYKFEERFKSLNNNDHCVFTVMIQEDLYDINLLPYCTGNIRDIRVSFHDYDLLEGLDYCKKVIEKGYNCYVNPINIAGYSDEQIVTIIDEVNKMGASTFTIVDTFGSLTIDDFKRIYYIVANNLNKDISIGVHFHDNLKLAFSLAQIAVDIMSDERELIIDGSLLGMGRAPGNLCIELIMQHLNMKMNSEYDIDVALDLIDKYIVKLKTEYPWGYETAYALSAQYKMHRSYAEYLVKKQKLRTKQIRQLLGMIPANKKSRYDEKYIEKIYEDYLSVNIDDSEFVNHFSEMVEGKSILLIAPGSSLAKYMSQIQNFINEYSPTIITANFVLPEIKEDYVFCSNGKRLDLLKSYNRHNRLILGSNLKEFGYEDSNYVNLYQLGWFGDVFWDNCMLMLIHLLRNVDVKTCYVAGWDGFSTENNFINPMMESVYKYENENELVKKIVNNYLGDMKIVFVTPSLYEIEDDLYYLYEYTDEVKVVPEHPSFASVQHYVDLGILNKEEMAEALRYKTKQ